MVQAVSEMDLGDKGTGAPEHGSNVATHMKSVGGAVHVTDVRGVDSANHVDGAVAVLHEVAWMGLKGEVDSFPFKDWEEFVHGAPELRLAGGGRFRPPVELRVQPPTAEFDRQGDHTPPVPHRGLSLPLIGPRPMEQREHRDNSDLLMLERFTKQAYSSATNAGMSEERNEVLAGRQLDRVEA
jgi:hypothetical protein